MRFIRAGFPDETANVQCWKIYTDDAHSYRMGDIEWDFIGRQYMFVPSGISLNAQMTREVCDFIDREAAARMSALRR